MKILNITTITELRGGDIQMYTIYKLLKEYKEIDQYIICPKDAELLQLTSKNDKIFKYHKKNKIFSIIPHIIKLNNKHKFDIIHIHDSSALTATLFAKIFFKKKSKIILSRKRDKKIKNILSQKLKYNNPNINKIICVSKAVESIFKDFIKDKSKLKTIYDGIDVKSFASMKNSNLIHDEFNWSRETKIIGNIASLTNQKDLITFVKSAELIINNYSGKSPLKFIIIGEGIQRKQIENYIASKSLESQIFLMGYRDNIKELLPEFDVFLITSISEGLPLSIYEAFACKVPVVSTAAGGIPEVIINKKTGFVSKIKDYEDLAKNTLELLNDDELINNITSNAFKLVSTKFDLKNLKENYYNVYKEVSSE